MAPDFGKPNAGVWLEGGAIDAFCWPKPEEGNVFGPKGTEDGFANFACPGRKGATAGFKPLLLPLAFLP